ncbi:MAG: (2Fe-2S)-binding protein [Myxococcota bacterium]
MVVCLCYGVNECEIERVVKDGADSLDAIGLMCNAGTGCGTCRATLSKTLIDAENQRASNETDWTVGPSAAVGVG